MFSFREVIPMSRRVWAVVTIYLCSGLALSAPAADQAYDIGQPVPHELKIKIGARPVAMGEAFVVQNDSGLMIGLGARPVAMGQAFVALADDLNTTVWNPAGLAQIKGYQAGFTHNIYLQSTSLEYLAYAQKLFEGAGIGANVTYLNYGTSFTLSVIAATIGYGQRILPGFTLGAAVKFIIQQIDNETYSEAAADLGLLFQPGLEGLQMGLTVQNLDIQMNDSNLPINIKAGAAYLLPVQAFEKDAWHLLADVNVPIDGKTSVNLGTEYTYKQTLSLRAGYSGQVSISGDMGGTTGLTVGAGLKYSIVELNYAMLSFGDLGLSHQIAIVVSY
jgi:hypothetical protein